MCMLAEGMLDNDLVIYSPFMLLSYAQILFLLLSLSHPRDRSFVDVMFHI
jgi:hypothetical protein